MLSFPEFLLSEEYAKPASRQRDLFLGRYSPFHKGHEAIVSMMSNDPVLVIVKGSKTSQDTTKNPFDEKYQQELIRKVFPHIEISVAPNGFLPGILGYFRKRGSEITRVFCGSDRIKGYSEAISKINQRMEPVYHYNVSFVETPRITSATKVREAIANGDYEQFKQLMPRQLWKEFDTMQKKMGV